MINYETLLTFHDRNRILDLRPQDVGPEDCGQVLDAHLVHS